MKWSGRGKSSDDGSEDWKEARVGFGVSCALQHKTHTKPASPRSSNWRQYNMCSATLIEEITKTTCHLQQHTQDGAIFLFRYKWFFVHYIVWSCLKTCSFSLSFQLLFHLEKQFKRNVPVTTDRKQCHKFRDTDLSDFHWLIVASMQTQMLSQHTGHVWSSRTKF